MRALNTLLAITALITPTEEKPMQCDHSGCPVRDHLMTNEDGLLMCRAHIGTVIEIDVFHKHLEVCAQCEKHPFNLCAEGQRKIRAEALQLGITMPEEPKF